MASAPQIKLVYIPAQYRVRAEISKWNVMQSPVPPADIIRRAKSKLQSEVDAGRLAYYRFFESRLVEFWRRLQQAEMSPGETLAVTLATGAPHMEGLHLEVSQDESMLGVLTIAAEALEVQAWRYPLFKLTVGKMLRQAGCLTIADPAHVKSLYLKAIEGARVIKEPILPLASGDMSQKPAGEWFRIVHHVDRREVAVVIYDVAALANDERIQDWCDQIRASVSKLGKETGCRYKLLDEDLVRQARSLFRGVERLGMDLPVTMLAAYRPTAARPLQAKSISTSAPQSEFRGKCEVEVTDSGMTATMKCHNTLGLQNISRDKWSAYLDSQGIVHGIDDVMLEELIQEVDAGRKRVEKVIAHGTEAMASSLPTLTRVMPATDNIRDAQQTKLVRSGDQIAQITFEVPGQPGQNVYGDVLQPPPAEIPEVQISDGIRSHDGLAFYAAIDGELAMDAFSLSLKAALSLVGDVNLATGNIFFDGSGEIKGNIEEGSTVHVTGDLHVKGAVLSANVSVGGHLVVDGGIIGSANSKVRVGNDLHCKFIENAIVECQGRVVAEKAVIASTVYCGVGLRTTATDAQVFGGLIEAWEFVECPNVGRPGGQLTKVYVGGRERQVKRLSRLQHREERLEKLLADDRLAQKYVEEKRRPGARDAEKFRTAKAEQMNRALEVIRSHIDIVRSTTQENVKARITVSGILYQNVNIRICGRPVTVKDSLESVEVLPTRHRGSFIWPLADAKMHRNAAS